MERQLQDALCGVREATLPFPIQEVSGSLGSLTFGAQQSGSHPSDRC